MGAAFGARTPIAAFMPRLREKIAGSAVPVAELRPWPKEMSPKVRVLAVEGKRNNETNSWLEETTLEALVSAQYYAVRIVRRRRRSPWDLDRGNLCYVTGQASNRTRASS